MQEYFRKIIEDTGEDLGRKGLEKTPERAAKAFEFLTQGYEQDLDKIVNNAVFDAECRDMVICKNIEIYSMCEHHMLPFFGKCHIGYIPDKSIIGISKLPRIADYYGRRLQLQERLTTQIAEAIEKYVKPSGVAVVIEAQHLCMMMRGVEKQNSVMMTSSMFGVFRENAATRQEFLSLIGK
jgi:GTP cyclohydrolase I